MRPMSLLASGALAIALAGPAAAADLGVIVTNENYRSVRDAETGVDVRRITAALEAAGFEVAALGDARAGQLHAWFHERREAMEAADRLVVVVAGHVVTNGRESWLLGTDAGRVSVFDAGAEGLPLAALEPFLAAKPGSAMLLVASTTPRSSDSGLALGYVAQEVAQGVTAVAGPGGELTALLADDILGAATPVGLAVEAREAAGMAGYGFLPRLVSFVSFAPVSTEDSAATERAAWETAEAELSEAAYEHYLARFPNGPNAAEARSRLRDLRLSPEARAVAAERDLRLDRTTRREMQDILTFLGYGTDGVDGIFGGGTRAALREWQSDEGLEPTGYLTEEQVDLLRELGGRPS